MVSSLPQPYSHMEGGRDEEHSDVIWDHRDVGVALEAAPALFWPGLGQAHGDFSHPSFPVHRNLCSSLGRKAEAAG